VKLINLQPETLQIKLSLIMADVGNAFHCSAHIPDASVRSLHLCIELHRLRSF